MKAIFVLIVLGIFCGFATAQTSQCQSIPKASDRLACYDKAAPPTAAGKASASKTSAPDKTAASNAPADQGTLVDMLAAENSKLDAKIKTICRGCWLRSTEEMTKAKHARRRWTPAEEQQFQDMLDAGKTALEISRKLRRTIRAIYARLQRIYWRRLGKVP
jgi:hypothetical protein